MTGFVQSKIELERDVQNELLNWKNKRHHTVLQIEGPWHVGKTHEVKKFVYSHYKQVVYVNLVRDEYGFEDLMLTDHFMREYCRNAGIGEYVDDESTVLVIDEIQERANVYNAIRHHCQRQLSCQNRQFQRLLPSGRDCVPSNVPAVIQRILQSIEYRRYIGNNQLEVRIQG